MSLLGMHVFEWNATKDVSVGNVCLVSISIQVVVRNACKVAPMCLKGMQLNPFIRMCLFGTHLQMFAGNASSDAYEMNATKDVSAMIHI
jgi:hypothetical protein